jgi:tungstate transport system substrate-binding protein
MQHHGLSSTNGQKSMHVSSFFRLLGLGLALALCTQTASANEPFITVSSTTSTEQSGLFGFLLPKFKEQTGIAVRVVALGTGQALDIGRRGDADVVFVHDRAAEDKFIAEGWGINRRDVMYNDFVVVGPGTDPAKLKGVKDAATGFRRIAESKASFVSRGDKSGTHAAELRLWKLADVDTAQLSTDWYRAIGSGMGPTLNTAAAMNAYTLSDRGTWLSFKNPQDLVIVLEGDKRLFNPYGVILVNPAKHAHVKEKQGQAFIDWLVSDKGQQAISDFTINGKPLFFPNAVKAL